jgi:hypothetical protein
MNCTRCRTHPPAPNRRRCYRCIKSTNEINKRARLKHLSILRQDQCDFCEKSFPVIHHNQACCSRACAVAMRTQAIGYVPFDSLLSKLWVRAMRALRYAGWLTAEEIGDVLGIENGNDELVQRTINGLRGMPPVGQRPQRNALGTALRRLYDSGLLERRPTSSACFEYRVKRGAPMVELYRVEAA